MSEEDVSTLRRAYEAFNRGDIEGAVQDFDPQIEWHELEGNPQAAGLFRGEEREDYPAAFPGACARSLPRPRLACAPLDRNPQGATGRVSIR